jgi:hypothetical protein
MPSSAGAVVPSFSTFLDENTFATIPMKSASHQNISNNSKGFNKFPHLSYSVRET